MLSSPDAQAATERRNAFHVSALAHALATIRLPCCHAHDHVPGSLSLSLIKFLTVHHRVPDHVLDPSLITSLTAPLPTPIASLIAPHRSRPRPRP